MQKIILTSDAKQSNRVKLPDASTIDFNFNYAPTQNSWFMDVAYGDKRLNGLRLVVSPNCLRQYSRILPFGVTVTSTNSVDPYFIDDFSEGRISVYVLDSDDLEMLENEYGI